MHLMPPLVLAQDNDVAMPVAPDQPPAQVETTESQPGTLPEGAAGRSEQTGTPGFFLLMMLFLLVMIIVMFGGQRKEKKKRAAMLESLTKGDKIQTVGGILGTIVEVRDQEVVVKVDENTNSRLRFARSAVQSVVEEKGE